MFTITHRALAGVVVAVMTSGAAAQTAASPPTDPGWPRTFTKEGSTVVVYQPQVDAWNQYETLRYRCALEVMPKGASGPSYGVAAVEADTKVSEQTDTVYLTNQRIAAVRFPGAPQDQAATVQAKPAMELAMSRVLAYMHDSPTPKGVKLNLDPPTIYYSDSPAILVVYMGQPQFQEVKGTDLMYAVNTNWLVLMDKGSQQYYLLEGTGWLRGSDPVHGPWTAADTLPPSFASLPTDGEWADVHKHIPAEPLKVVPTVYASTEPAELIVTQGPPSLTPVTGTSLMYVSNPMMPVFMDLTDSDYYYLVAGRWFRASAVTGPWSAASADLPAEFAKIPEDSPVSFVLPSIPGTIEAKDAILLAQVPHKATVDISKAKVSVAYQGEPKFVPISGTSMAYATNTAYEVISTGGKYYCCDAGVWFVASAATGPWVVCTSVPQVIYTIPSSCPVYNVTYVKVYSSTPTTVVTGYTSGYSGAYVAATGALMFGAGMALGAAIANNNDCWHPYNPCFYSYGCAPVYHYGAGGFYAGGAVHYGPYGGAGWSAGYNPATGTYSRSGYAYGPRGAAGYHQAYNPWTNTYGAHAGASNGYRSWGASTVSRGDDWASAAHATGPGGVTRGWAENSSGETARAVSGNRGTVGATSSGDLYAGRDGNVYRNSGSGWQSYSNGSWNDVQKPDRPAGSTAQGSGSWQNHPQNSWNQNWKSNFNASDSSWKGQYGQQASQRGAAASSDRSGGGQRSQWASQDTLNGLNHDSFARSQGNASAAERESGGRFGGGGGFQGFDRSGGGRSFGGGRGRR